MARNRDLFDDTTMTFGEHLEALRVHLWKSLIGVAIGVAISMIVGDRIIGILKAPIEKALRDANIEDVQDDVAEVSLFDFFSDWFSSEESDGEPQLTPRPAEPEPLSDSLTVEVLTKDVVNAVRSTAPELIAERLPPADNSEQPEGTDQEMQSASPEYITITLKSPEIAMLKQAAERFNSPVTFRVEEAFLTYLKVALVSGLMLASPWVFYQIWQFVAAGLHSHERRYVHIYLPMSIGLFVSGALFCFYLVFPLVLSFLIGFSHWLDVEIHPRLSEYISLVLMLPLMFGISFQLPLVMLFLERIGIVTVQTYTTNWRMAVLIMAVVSMLLTPQDPGSMLLMLLPLIVLYIGGIQLCRMRLASAKDPLA